MPGFSINTVVISGNLTRDPELRSLPNGTPVCELGVAVNERIKQGDQWTDRPNYFDVTVWGGMGEWVGRNLSKGMGVAVEGRLRFESWEKDGQKRSKVKIVANSVVPIPRDGQSNGNGNGQASTGGYGGGQQASAGGYGGDFAPAPAGAYGGGTTAPADDDIPF